MIRKNRDALIAALEDAMSWWTLRTMEVPFTDAEKRAEDQTIDRILALIADAKKQTAA